MPPHSPLRSARPGWQKVHWPIPVHVVHEASHGSQRPLVSLPKSPAGQSAVQLPPSRYGRLVDALHAVQLSLSCGAEHVRQAAEHRAHTPLAFGAKPSGHAATHRPMYLRGAATGQLRQLAALGPSHVAQPEWHAPHVPLVVRYSPAAHASWHLPSTSAGRIHGAGLHDTHTVGSDGRQALQSKLRQSAHSIPPPGIVTGYLPSRHE